MEINNIIYSNPKQAVLPMLIQDYLDICDPVLTFDRVMGKIELEKYLDNKSKMTQISQYELQKGNWKEESEIEKLIELKTLVENLTINTRIVTDGASNLIQVRGNLPADKKKLIKHLEYQISNADEASLREYRVNLRHL